MNENKSNIKAYIQNKFVNHLIIILGVIVGAVLIISLWALIENTVFGSHKIENELKVEENCESAKTDQERIKKELEMLRANKSAELENHTISLLNILILSITAWAVLLYTFETRRMRKETSGINEETKNLRVLNEKQIALQYWPVLVLFVDTDSGGFHRLFLKNIGESLAVKIDIIGKSFHVIHNNYACNPVFEKISGVAKNDQVSPGLIYTNLKAEEKKIPSGAPIKITFQPEQEIEIYYENLMGEKFFSSIALGWKESILKDFKKI